MILTPERVLHRSAPLANQALRLVFVQLRLVALGRALEALPDGGRALVVGHSPTNEAAVLGLTGEIVGPISKGAGVLLVAADQGFRVESLD
jgi:hypothetical protein